METTNKQAGLKSSEVWTVIVGFFLVGIIIAVTAVSYIMHSTFEIRWLVWGIGAAFMVVALLALEWPRAYRSSPGNVPKGLVRQFLLVAMPLSYILGSQICGLGFRACTVYCNIINVVLILLAAIIAFIFSRGYSVGTLLIPLIIISIIPHCVCMAPVNLLWHNIFAGYAPTCEIIPLAAVLFSLTALRGLRTRASVALVVVILAVIVFIAVGNPLFGFPWQGCVD